MTLGCGPSVSVVATDTDSEASTVDPDVPRPTVDLGDAAPPLAPPPESPLAPAEALRVATWCEANGTRGLRVEVDLSGRGTECSLPTDLQPRDYLVLMLADWDGESGTYAAGESQPARAAHGYTALEGSITVQVSAPGVPERVEVELHAPAERISGFLDLSSCFVADAGDVTC